MFVSTGSMYGKDETWPTVLGILWSLEKHQKTVDINITMHFQEEIKRILKQEINKI